MRRLLLIAFLAVLSLSLGLVLSCGDDDDDDDSGGDDDAGDDDADDDDAENDTWTDSTSGLMWQNGSSVGSEYYAWDEALSYCESLSWGGFDDWRLPTISELRS